MSATAEAFIRARMRFSRALQPARQAKHVAGRWMRRQFSRVPGVEPRPLSQAGVPGVEIVRLLPPPRQPIILPLPRQLGREEARFFRKRQRVPVFERYLARIHGARIHGLDGFLYLPDGRVLLDHHFNFRDYVENSDLYLARLPAPRPIEGPVFPMIGFCPGAHYHWMTEVLYRLHDCLDLLPPQTRFLIPSRVSGVHREALRALGIGPERFLEMDGEDHFEFRELWYAPPVTRSGYDIPEAARWVRDRFASHFDAHAPRPARDAAGGGELKLYISRRGARQRRIVNEDALVEALQALGYTCVESEKLGFFEQAAIYSRAREIVAPHGAGLVNLLFTRPGGRLLEVFPEAIPPGGMCYWSLAFAMQWDYTCMRGSISARAGHPSDMLVDVDSIRTWSQAAGAAPPVPP